MQHLAKQDVRLVKYMILLQYVTSITRLLAIEMAPNGEFSTFIQPLRTHPALVQDCNRLGAPSSSRFGLNLSPQLSRRLTRGTNVHRVIVLAGVESDALIFW